MKKTIITLAMAAALLAGCAREAKSPAISEDASENVMSSSAATVNVEGKKFVKTADISMEVKDVYQSTLNIEQSVSSVGGYVTESDLQSHVLSEEVSPLNEDSAKEIKKYYLTANLTVRVPNAKMGDFLMILNQEVQFPNYRIIKAEDVTLNLRSSDLDIQKLQNSQNKLDTLLKQKGNISRKSEIVENREEKADQINQNRIKKLDLNDKISYSTLSIQLEGKPKIKTTIIANTDKSIDFSGLKYKTLHALEGGLYYLQNVVVALLYLWPLWILCVIVYFLYKKKRYFNKNN